jgi:hypothetical protein
MSHPLKGVVEGVAAAAVAVVAVPQWGAADTAVPV